jgi:hypothetical protein
MTGTPFPGVALARGGEPGPLFLGEEKGAEARSLQRLSDWGIRYALKRKLLAGAVAKRLTPHALKQHES